MNISIIVLTLGGRVITVLSILATSIISARFLGPEGRGEYFYVITFSALISQLSNIGLHSSNTYLVAKNKARLGCLFMNSLWVSAIVGTVATALFMSALYLLGFATGETMTKLWFAFILVPTNLFFVLGCSLLVGINSMSAFNLLQMGGYGLVALLTGLAGLAGADVYGFLLVASIAWIVTAGILVYVLKKSAGHAKFNWDIIRTGFPYAIKAYFATLFGLLVLRGNIFLLKELASLKEVGYFSIAAQIADAVGIVPVTIGMVLFPKLVQNQNDAWKMTKQMLAIVSIIMVVLCVVAILLGDFFIGLVYGKAFLPSVSMMIWLMPGAFCLGATSILSQYLSSTGFPISQVVIWFMSFIIIVVLSGFLIPQLFGAGAAIAQSATYVLTFIMMFILSIRTKRNMANYSSHP